ncbi:fucose isomerase [Butyrivibrio sp. VCB2006]|uniref:fucose isomerase n=1 Tax=Butyrivibrio sp. VCB2006 TaxID=1280679 RepID=UPI00040C3C35|nr:fucose isomerase [Butyrivibrio sp. VCB2006]
MKQFQVAYIPVGVPTFHLESAQKEFDKSVALLKELAENVAVPQEMLLSIDKLNAFLDTIEPDLIVLQNITFANAAYASEVLHRFKDVPILLWTLREPVIDGGRLRLNSLTGAYSAANTIKAFRKEPFEYIFGGPTEDKVKEKVGATIRAAKLKFKMRNLKLSAIGHTPQGFGFGRALDLEMLEKFGVRLESIETRELIDKAKAFTEEECADYLKDASQRIKGLDKTPEQNRNDFARLYKAYEEYVKDNNIGAIASRCWPDFFTAFGTPVCAVLAMLNDLGVAASCEADTYGALSMYLGMQLTGSATFFGDPVSMDEKENTISFWHCGTAACSLARTDTGACAGEHCNRHIGPTLEFGCKPCERATIFRIGRDSEGNFRFFIASGEILDKPQQFLGTSLVVKTDGSAEEIIYKTVEEGWEPHYVVIYGDVANELEILAHMLGMKTLKL